MKTIIYTIFTLLLLSCTKEQKITDTVSQININTSIEETTTKTIYSGTKFPSGGTLGMFVFHAENNVPLQNYTIYGERYKNVRASLSNAGKWTYRFEESTTTFDQFYILKPNVNLYTEGLAIYSYAPWIEGCSDIRSIPFEIGGESINPRDLMWAAQNGTDANAKIIPDGNSKTASFKFKHALSMLKIGLKCKYDDSEIKVTSITIKKKTDGKTELYKTGKFNAVSGTFTFDEDDKATSVSTIYESENVVFSKNAAKDVPFLIFPVNEYISDGDYIISFKFNGTDLSAEYPIKRNDIKITENGNDVYAMKQGYSYKFNFTFNNYMQIDNVKINVSSNWDVVENELMF